MKIYVIIDFSQLRVQRILLYNNQLETIPPTVLRLKNLTYIDLSNNIIRELPPDITSLTCVTHLYLRNNLLGDDDLPKDMGTLKLTLRDLNISGNRFTTIPPSIISLRGLRNLFMGGNRITSIPSAIQELRRLRVLYAGGNFLKTLPEEICHLTHLSALIIADNQLESLPNSICELKRLQCLQLHQNRLTTLPNGLIHLKCLRELSLRDNPLVVRFVRDMNFQPSTLLELASIKIKVAGIRYEEEDLPRVVNEYMKNSHSCVNPNCKGVFFDSKVEHVKFVDFCGKYRVPLMQYLCSSRCHVDKPAYSDEGRRDSTIDAAKIEEESKKMRKVLLG